MSGVLQSLKVLDPWWPSGFDLGVCSRVTWSVWSGLITVSVPTRTQVARIYFSTLMLEKSPEVFLRQILWGPFMTGKWRVMMSTPSSRHSWSLTCDSRWRKVNVSMWKEGDKTGADKLKTCCKLLINDESSSCPLCEYTRHHTQHTSQ